ncbi:hypothetical protein [Lysinibacillus sp. LZ02]|uniref:hypothetical protein n=1 Tax=Lysinibacillus sp. LZ02 TaxID=3420668 RepID=UPI003D36679F
MTGMDESLLPQKSRITIFNKLVICRFCSNDVFIPYEVIVNVEQPGIGVHHVRYAAICQYCGEVKHFGDPSYYDAEKGNYIWALNQFLLSVKKYRVKILFYVGKRKQDKKTIFINKLMQDFGAEIENVKEFKEEVLLQIRFSDLNDIQTNKIRIMSCAKRLNIYVKELTIK